MEVAKAEEVYKYNVDILNTLPFLVDQNILCESDFVAELIFNAIDAVKSRTTYNSRQLNADFYWESINVTLDKWNRAITVTDNGIGMEKSDLIKNLGYLFTSGWHRRLKPTPTLGVHGVGFFATLLASRRVTVTTQRINGGRVWQWKSQYPWKNYRIRQIRQRETIYGTTVRLELRNCVLHYLNSKFFEEIVLKRFKFIDIPISFTIIRSDHTDEFTLDPCEPIWTIPSWSEGIHASFYKELTKDGNGYMGIQNQIILGNNVLLYLPKYPNKVKSPGIRLYRRRILVDNDYKILPKGLDFIHGVIASESLEIKQSNEDRHSFNLYMREFVKRLIAFCHEMLILTTSAENFHETYDEKIKAYMLKLEDKDINMPVEILEVLQFKIFSYEMKSKTLGEFRNSLVARSQPMFFMPECTMEEFESSPLSEVFIEKEINLILSLTSADDGVLRIASIRGLYNLHCLTQTGCSPSLTSVETNKYKHSDRLFEPLCRFIKIIMGSLYVNVVVSRRLKYSPCCVTVPRHHPDFIGDRDGLKKDMKRNIRGKEPIWIKPTRDVEINPNNSIIMQLNRDLNDFDKFDECGKLYHGENPNVDDRFESWIYLLVKADEMCSGYFLDDVDKYVKIIYDELTWICEPELDPTLDHTKPVEIEKPDLKSNQEVKRTPPKILRESVVKQLNHIQSRKTIIPKSKIIVPKNKITVPKSKKIVPKSKNIVPKSKKNVLKSISSLIYCHEDDDSDVVDVSDIPRLLKLKQQKKANATQNNNNDSLDDLLLSRGVQGSIAPVVNNSKGIEPIVEILIDEDEIYSGSSETLSPGECRRLRRSEDHVSYTDESSDDNPLSDSRKRELLVSSGRVPANSGNRSTSTITHKKTPIATVQPYQMTFEGMNDAEADDAQLQLAIQLSLEG